MQDWFNIQISTNVICHVNKLIKKNNETLHDQLNWQRKNIWQNPLIPFQFAWINLDIHTNEWTLINNSFYILY